MNEDYSVIDMLLDPDNESPIVLQNEKGEHVSFDQIAIIPYNDKLYAILKPITPVEGVGENEALVFELLYEEDSLVIINNFEICDSVFDIYYDLLKQESFN